MYSAVLGRVFVGLPIPVHTESLCLGPSYSRCPAFRLTFSPINLTKAPLLLHFVNPTLFFQQFYGSALLSFTMVMIY